MSSSVEQIKERLAIADVVGSYVTLEQAGSNLRARCPFHNEKTPSFFVSPDRNSFYCFGCGVKGDIFTFVEQFEGIDFPGALHLLAERAGVNLTKGDSGARREKGSLYEILEEAAVFFEKTLTTHPKAQGYLADRGLSADTVALWRVGYVEPSWRGLAEHLERMGKTLADIEKAGLVKKSDKGYYDRFRGRIMFPIADGSGRIVAFSGRLFDSKEVHGKEEAPKYVNSPETPLFTKSKILHGYDKAKAAIRKLDFSIVVEGQMDLLMSHQSGFRNTVALSGTALSSDHLRMLSRISSNILFCFDADAAGMNSAGKSAEAALALGMNVKVASLPRGLDPADLIKENPDAWKEVIRSATHIIDFYLGALSGQYRDERAFKLKVREIVLPYVAKIENRIDQEHFIAKIAASLAVPEDAVRREVEKLGSGSGVPAVKNAPVEGESPLSRKDGIVRKLAHILLWQQHTKNPRIDTTDVEERVRGYAPNLDEWLENIQKNDYTKVLFEQELFYDTAGVLEDDVSDLLHNLEIECLKESFQIHVTKLKQAEAVGNAEETQALLTACNRIKEQISRLRK